MVINQIMIFANTNQACYYRQTEVKYRDVFLLTITELTANCEKIYYYIANLRSTPIYLVRKQY